ncbi:hypothetical protein E2C01_100725 [Portunus trituberculatus]|uniref:Uncharacterized protein n=1 Tax=Portunus trituberculatus TaxID=210409 RepID=A0A5B7KEB6_PORTR|nr:hypothetical protein [Portunus trituberculatus]
MVIIQCQNRDNSTTSFGIVFAIKKILNTIKIKVVSNINSNVTNLHHMPFSQYSSTDTELLLDG